jgi:hypothetical protein
MGRILNIPLNIGSDNWAGTPPLVDCENALDLDSECLIKNDEE